MDHKAINYKNIPVQADVISGIIRLDSESNNCFRELDNYLRSDQGVAMLVLKVANSPLYSRGRRIATIPTAITVLGFNVVRSLAMLAFSRSMFSKSRNPLFRLHIWQHSLLVALAGQLICQGLGGEKTKDEAFIAGLMHDMGKVLLFTHDEARYLEVFDLIFEHGSNCSEAETRISGCDSHQVGTEAVIQWKLPERFADYMGRDLSSTRPGLEADKVLQSLMVANMLIESAGVGGRAEPDSTAYKAVLSELGLAAAQYEPWLLPEFITNLMADETYQLFASL